MAVDDRRLGYRPALDGLRGVAVLAVVAYHFDHDAVPGGWIGVDVFFALSGFLITSLLLSEWDRDGGVWLSGFYQRRTLRLVPALVAFLACVALYRWLADGEPLSNFAGWLPFVYVTNISVAFDVGDVPFTHIWSLAAEEQFYLLWPPLLVVLLRRKVSREGIVAVTAGLTIGSAGTTFVLWLQGAHWMRLYFGPDTHAVPILAGCLLAELWVWRMIPTRVARSAWVAAPALALGVMVLRPQSDLVYAGGLAVMAVAACLVVLGAVELPAFVRVLSARPLVHVGRISYALYLWHWVLLYEIGGNTPRRVLAIVVSYVLAAVSMRVVEAPFLALKKRVQPSVTLDPVVLDPTPSAFGD